MNPYAPPKSASPKKPSHIVEWAGITIVGVASAGLSVVQVGSSWGVLVGVALFSLIAWCRHDAIENADTSWLAQWFLRHLDSDRNWRPFAFLRPPRDHDLTFLRSLLFSGAMGAVVSSLFLAIRAAFHWQVTTPAIAVIVALVVCAMSAQWFAGASFWNVRAKRLRDVRTTRGFVDEVCCSSRTA